MGYGGRLAVMWQHQIVLVVRWLGQLLLQLTIVMLAKLYNEFYALARRRSSGNCKPVLLVPVLDLLLLRQWLSSSL
jgi:hypothetical protein